MTKLLGTKPNQAPTNADLGDLAYQDMDKLPTINVADDGFVVTEAGNVGIATASPTQKLDVNDDSIRVRTAKTPASASDTGTQGQIAWDADYIYVCTATDTWKRVAIATW
jgi:hypothetical protein